MAQSPKDHEVDVERRAFKKAVFKGLGDLEGGRELGLAEVGKWLSIWDVKPRRPD